ncbi:hypothetical protein PG985_004287 [Apiospora marii]|uniref:Uncharacterized protein n=1 Tax=Apiospora marii TaxID=335849 RepID=A0ABR1S8V6_9PEZI
MSKPSTPRLARVGHRAQSATESQDVWMGYAAQGFQVRKIFRKLSGETMRGEPNTGEYGRYPEIGGLPYAKGSFLGRRVRPLFRRNTSKPNANGFALSKVTADPGTRGKDPTVRPLTPDDSLHPPGPWPEPNPDSGVKPMREDRHMSSITASNSSMSRGYGSSSRDSLPKEPDNAHEEQIAVLQHQVRSLKLEMEDMKASYQEGMLEQVQTIEWLQRKVQEKAGPIRTQVISGIGLLPDSEIISRWRKLMWELGQIVSSNVVEPSPYHTPSKFRPGFLQKITLQPETFLHSKEDRVDLVQAVIWDHLAKFVFTSRTCPSRGYWAGELCDKFYDLNKSVAGSGQCGDAHYHLWRSQTAALLSSYAKRDNVKANAYETVARIQKDLRGLLKTRDPSLVQQLFDFILEAIQLDSDLSQQMASWFCEYPGDSRHGIEFNDFAMKPVNNNFEKGATCVTLIVAPALMKAGNSAGNHYEAEQLMVESAVYLGSPYLTDKKPTVVAQMSYQDQKRAARSAKDTQDKSFSKRRSFWA